jgi:hypothetical protein
MILPRAVAGALRVRRQLRLGQIIVTRLSPSVLLLMAFLERGGTGLSCGSRWTTAGLHAQRATRLGRTAVFPLDVRLNARTQVKHSKHL